MKPRKHTVVGRYVDNGQALSFDVTVPIASAKQDYDSRVHQICQAAWVKIGDEVWAEERKEHPDYSHQEVMEVLIILDCIGAAQTFWSEPGNR